MLNPRVVDEEFRAEAHEARSQGHTILRVNLEALERDNRDVVLPWPALDSQESFIYRGWMLTPGLYDDLTLRLAKKNASLLTSPQHYRQSHELPGWLDEMRDYTAKTVELTATELAPMG